MKCPQGPKVYDWSKSFKEGQTEVKTAPSAGKVMAIILWNSQGILFIDFCFLTEQQTISAGYYSKLLKERVKPTFHSE
jgi:hypothetical protein